MVVSVMADLALASSTRVLFWARAAMRVLRVSDLEDGGATGGEDEPNLVGYAR